MAGHDFEVAVGALRQEAGVWTAQAGQMQALAGRAGGLTMSGLQGGIFIAMVSAHNKVCNKITSMCTAGGTAFMEIGSTLTKAAQIYETEDRNRAHEYRKLY